MTVFFNPVRLLSLYLLASLLSGPVQPVAAEVSPRKVALIRQAITAMKLDGRIQAMIDTKVEARVQKIRIENPVLPDSVVPVVRATVAQVYAENRDGRDGLDARVYAVIDRHLTEEDLKFASNFSASDNGKRYREVAPRLVSESVEAVRKWEESLEPEVRGRLGVQFRELGLKL